MKKPILGRITPLCLLLAAGVSITRADSLTWDPLFNSGGGGTGAWNLNTTANWYNGTTDVQWKDNSATGTNAAIFGGTAGTVTVANALSASNLQFNASGYTFSGSGVLTLGTGGINATNLTGGTTTIGIGLSLPLGQQAWQVGAGSTLAVNGTVTRAAGASVDFSVPGITSTSLNNVNGILGGWATTGNFVPSNATGDWAANDGSGNIIAYTGYTLMTGVVDGSAGTAQNWESSAPGNVITFTGNANLNSLVMQGDVIVSNNFTLTLGSGGLILKGISRWLIDQTGGTVGNAVIMSGAPNGEFFVHVPNGNTLNNGTDGGNWRIWPQIKDNGATPLKLFKDGPGCVSLQNTNTYTGGTWINNGILCAGGADTTVAIAPVTLGSGNVTINPQGIMEIGYGTGNANLDYLYPNNVILNGGKILADDGHNRVTGTISVTAAGGTLGSTYDGGGNGTTGNKALFIDGVVSGSGPLNLQQAVDAGDNDRYGNGGGNPYNSSVVEFGNAANTYSGVITVIPYSTGAGAGSYVTINASTALQFATLNLTNNPGGHRYAGLNGLFSPLVFNTGLGSATIANITGNADIILNGFNENTYAVQADGVTLTIGNGANSSYPGNFTGAGGLTKIGNGILTLGGQNTFTGTTMVSGGSLALTGSWLNSSNVVIGTGRTLDASALGTVAMPATQALQSDGTLSASVNTTAGSAIFGGGDGTYGTNAITGSLTLATGAAAFMDVGATVAGANDKVTVGGTLTANNNSIHLKAPNTSVSLETADYVLFSSPNNISGTFATTPVWDVAPANANHYSIVTGAKTVTLHYSAVGGPGGVGTTSPSPALRNQNLLITVTAVNGTAGTVNSVVVDASSLGASSTLALVNSGGNVWTNSVTVPSNLTTGLKNLVATVSDTAALTAIVNITATIAAGTDVWNGGGADDNLSTALNWTNHLAPALIGDSLQFAGATRLTPNVDNNYVVAGIQFNTNAGAFNIGSASSTLTLTNGSGVVNLSANIQTLSAPIMLGASQTFATTSNNIVVSGGVSEGATSAGLTKTGNSAMTLGGNNTYTGPTTVNRGTMNITGTVGTLGNNSSTFVGSVAGTSILNITDPNANLSAFYLLLGNVTNSVGVVNQTAGTVNANANSGFDNLSVGNVAGAYGYYGANGGTFTVNGICIGGEVNTGGGANFNGAGGNGIMDINNAAVTDSGWLVIARQNGGTTIGPSIGILNVYSGTLTYAGGGIVGPWDTGETAIINIMGGSVTGSQGVRLGNTGFQGVLNLNGGLLQTSDLSGYNAPTFTIVTNGLVNFNGGTLQAAGSTTDFIRVAAARIFSGGLTIDNAGNGIIINQSLVAPSGNGVHGITSFTPGAGYIAPPIVVVTNGVGDTTGSGATAIAQVNPATGTVTNVLITCPGVNYTATPIFLVSGGGATTAATITGAAPTANTGGGVTFIGSSVTELTATNTYAGNTTVGAGTLELANPVIPFTSTVVVSNGAVVQLDFSVTNTIAGLVLNGVSQAQGVYNSTTSPSFITGSGSLLVGTPTTASNPTNITFSVTGNGPGASMTISWPADHLGWILQQATNLTVGGWTDVPGTGSSTSTIVPITATPPDKYYRLRHP